MTKDKLSRDIYSLGMVKKTLQREIDANSNNLSLGYKKLEDINKAISDTYRIKSQVEKETEEAKLRYEIVIQNIKNDKQKINAEYERLEKDKATYKKKIEEIDKEVIALREVRNKTIKEIGELKKAHNDIVSKKKTIAILKKEINKYTVKLKNVQKDIYQGEKRFDKDIKDKAIRIATLIDNIIKLEKQENRLSKKIELMQVADKTNIDNYNKRKAELQDKEKELTIIYGRLRKASKKIFNTDLRL